MNKYLLFYMNTSDYKNIQKDIKKIPCDKIIIHYMPYPFPHELARDYFLEHEEYSHLIVCPQDLHPTKEAYQELIKTVEKNANPYSDFTIVKTLKSSLKNTNLRLCLKSENALLEENCGVAGSSRTAPRILVDTG